jgi:hypothetical protein
MTSLIGLWKVCDEGKLEENESRNVSETKGDANM